MLDLYEVGKVAWGVSLATRSFSLKLGNVHLAVYRP